MHCDGEGRRNYDVDLPRPQNKQGDWDGDTVLVSVAYQCKFTTTDEDGVVTPMEDKEEGKRQMRARICLLPSSLSSIGVTTPSSSVVVNLH